MYTCIPWTVQPDNEIASQNDFPWTYESGMVRPGTMNMGTVIVTDHRVHFIGGRSSFSVSNLNYSAPLVNGVIVGPWEAEPSLTDSRAYTYRIIFCTGPRVYCISSYDVYYSVLTPDGRLGPWTLQGAANQGGAGLNNRAIILGDKLHIGWGSLNYTLYTTTITDGVIDHLGFQYLNYGQAQFSTYVHVFRTATRVYICGADSYNLGGGNAYTYWAPIDENNYINPANELWTKGPRWPSNYGPWQIMVTKNWFYGFGSAQSTTATASGRRIFRAPIDPVTGVLGEFVATDGLVTNSTQELRIFSTSSKLIELRYAYHTPWTGGLDDYFASEQHTSDTIIEAPLIEISSEVVDGVPVGMIDTAFESPVPSLDGVIDNPLEQFYDIVAFVPEVSSYTFNFGITSDTSISITRQVKCGVTQASDPLVVVHNPVPWRSWAHRSEIPSSHLTSGTSTTIPVTKPPSAYVGAVFITNKILFAVCTFPGYLGFIQSMRINTDGTVQPDERAAEFPFIETGNRYRVFYTRNRIYFISTAVDGSSYKPRAVWSYGITNEGFLGPLELGPNLPVGREDFKIFIVKDKIYLAGGKASTYNDIVYSATIDQFGRLSHWVVDAFVLPVILGAASVVRTKNRVHFLFGYKVYRLIVDDETGAIGAWSELADCPVQQWDSSACMCSSTHFTAGGAYTTIDENGDLGTWQTGSGFSEDAFIHNFAFQPSGTNGVYRRAFAPIGIINHTHQLEHLDINGDIEAPIPEIESELSTVQDIITIQGYYEVLAEIYSWVGVVQFYNTYFRAPRAALSASVVHENPNPVDHVCGNPWLNQVKFNDVQVDTFSYPYTYMNTLVDIYRNSTGEFFVTTDRVYLVGGLYKINPGTYNYEFYYADILTAEIFSDDSLGEWTLSEIKLPEELYDSKVIVTRGHVYIIGGARRSLDGLGVPSSAVYVAEIFPSGFIGEWSYHSSLPAVARWLTAFVTKNRLFVFQENKNNPLELWYAEIHFDGTVSTAWHTHPTFNKYVLDVTVFEDRVWFLGGPIQFQPNKAYTALVSEFGELGDLVEDAQAFNVCTITTKHRLFRLGGSVTSAIRYPDGTTSAYITDHVSPDFSYSFVVGSRIYRLYNNTQLYYSEFHGGTSDTQVSGYVFIENELYSNIPSTFRAPRAQINSFVTVQNFDVFDEFPYPNGIPWQQQWAFNSEQSGAPENPTDQDSLPFEIRNMSGFVTKRKVYISGGFRAYPFSYPEYTDEIFVADLLSNKLLGPWTLAGYLPYKFYRHQCFNTKSHTYIVGGQYPDPATTVNTNIWAAPIYDDGTIGTYTIVGDMPDVIYGFSIATYLDRVYIVAGVLHTGGEYYATNIIYSAPINTDGTLGTWREEVNYLPKSIYGAHVFITDALITVAGGFDAAAEMSTTDAYQAAINPSTGEIGSFVYANSLSFPVQDGSCVISEQAAYIFGGQYTYWVMVNVTLTEYVESTPTQWATVYPNGSIGTWVETAHESNRFSTLTAIVEDRLFIIGGSHLSGFQRSYNNAVKYIPFLGGSPNYTQFPWYTDPLPDFDIRTRAEIKSEVGGPISFRAPLPAVSLVMAPNTPVFCNLVVKKPMVQSGTTTVIYIAGDFKAPKAGVSADVLNDNILVLTGRFESLVPVIESAGINSINIFGDFQAVTEIQGYGINSIAIFGNYEAPVPHIKATGVPIQIDVNIVAPLHRYFAWDYEAVINYRVTKPDVKGTMFDTIGKLISPKPLVSSWTDDNVFRLVTFKPNINSEVTSGNYFFVNYNTKVAKISTTFGTDTMFNSPRVEVNALVVTDYFLTGQWVQKKPIINSALLGNKALSVDYRAKLSVINSTASTTKFLSAQYSAPSISIMASTEFHNLISCAIQSPCYKLSSFTYLHSIINTVLYSRIELNGALYMDGSFNGNLHAKKPMIMSTTDISLDYEIIRYRGDELCRQ